jgi:hypothetical protein
MKWICKYCNVEFNFEKIQSSGAHIVNCSLNPNLEEIKNKRSMTHSKSRIERSVKYNIFCL